MSKIDKSKMKCNTPRRTPDGPKKFVVKACEGGTEKIIRFGDPNMKIRKSNPKARNHFGRDISATANRLNSLHGIGRAGTGSDPQASSLLCLFADCSGFSDELLLHRKGIYIWQRTASSEI